MAKKRGRGESVMGYFRQIFKENPGWLSEKSNAAILARYRADNGMAEDASLDKKVTANLANLKSVLRKKQRDDEGTSNGLAPKVAATAASSSRGGQRLEALEEMIDDALTFAKNVDREGLNDVIMLLRRARNQVVWKLGQ